VVERGVLNDAYSIANVPRGVAPKPKAPRPKKEPDAPKTPGAPGKNPGDPGYNPAAGKSNKCVRKLNGRCSDGEESDIEMSDAADSDADPNLEDLGYDAYLQKGKQTNADANAKIAKVKNDPANNPDKTPPKWNVDDGGSYQFEQIDAQTPGWNYFEVVATVFRDLGLDKGKTVFQGAKVRAVDGSGKSKLVGENYISRIKDSQDSGQVSLPLVSLVLEACIYGLP